jgi:hypothetical protein
MKDAYWITSAILGHSWSRVLGLISKNSQVSVYPCQVRHGLGTQALTLQGWIVINVLAAVGTA